MIRKSSLCEAAQRMREKSRRMEWRFVCIGQWRYYHNFCAVIHVIFLCRINFRSFSSPFCSFGTNMLVSNINKISFHSPFSFWNIEALWRLALMLYDSNFVHELNLKESQNETEIRFINFYFVTIDRIGLPDTVLCSGARVEGWNNLRFLFAIVMETFLT